MIAKLQIDRKVNDWILQPLDPPVVFSLEMLFLYAGILKGPVPTEPL